MFFHLRIIILVYISDKLLNLEKQRNKGYPAVHGLPSQSLRSSDGKDNDTENTLAHILICSFEGLTFHYFMTLGKSLAHATNMYYTITYMAAPGKYRRYLPIAEHMIRSIRIL